MIIFFSVAFFLQSCNAQTSTSSYTVFSEQYPFKYSLNQRILIIKEENRLFQYDDSLVYTGTFDIPYSFEDLLESIDYYLCPIGQEEKYEKTYVYDKEFSLKKILNNFQIESVIDFEKNLILAYYDTLIHNSTYFFKYYIYNLSSDDTLYSFPKNNEVLFSDAIYSYSTGTNSFIITRYDNNFGIDTTFKINMSETDAKLFFICKDYYIIRNDNSYELYNFKNKLINMFTIDGFDVKYHFDKTKNSVKLYYWLQNGSLFEFTEIRII